MHIKNSFFTDEENNLSTRFIKDGYVIQEVEDKISLERIIQFISSTIIEKFALKEHIEPLILLNNIHNYINSEELNNVRLLLINAINNESWFRQAFYKIGSKLISSLVGNELVMQRRINLSIQLPNDASSLLPVHSDVWSGDSPYEAVMWLPLVDCYKTKSMYIMNPNENQLIEKNIFDGSHSSAEQLFKTIENKISFLDVPYGHFIIFNQNLMHGNRVNEEKESRWSMNCRFKSVFSPYSDKRIGEFFDPITLRPVTSYAMNYDFPKKNSD